MQAPAQVQAPAQATAPAQPAPPAEQAGENRGLLGRFYSAISSGGGVSLPDLFTSDPPAAETPPETPPEPQSERRP